MKITGVNPLLPLDDDEELALPDPLCPDICGSTGDVNFDPSELSNLSSFEPDIVPSLLCDKDEDDEIELDEFLLDAVQWL